jgi:hypothetical protein
VLLDESGEGAVPHGGESRVQGGSERGETAEQMSTPAIGTTNSDKQPETKQTKQHENTERGDVFVFVVCCLPGHDGLWAGQVDESVPLEQVVGVAGGAQSGGEMAETASDHGHSTGVPGREEGG